MFSTCNRWFQAPLPPVIAFCDEPFGPVAVEFGRKGDLGVGSQLGGVTPGWVSRVVIRSILRVC